MKRILYDNKKNELIWVTITVYNTPNDDIIIKGDESGIVVKKNKEKFSLRILHPNQSRRSSEINAKN